MILRPDGIPQKGMIEIESPLYIYINEIKTE